MTPIYNQKHNYCMFYAPKAACSFMRALYIDVHYNEFDIEQKEFIARRGIHGLNLIHNQILQEDKITFTKKYFVCRDPYTRCLSAFYDKFLNVFSSKDVPTSKLKLQFLYQLFLNNCSKDILQTYCNDNSLYICSNSVDELLTALKLKIKIQPLTFKEYLNFLRYCFKNNIPAYDHHHNTQTYMLQYNIKSIFNNIHLVHIERFEEELHNMCLHLFTSSLTKKYLKSFKKLSQNKKFLNDTPPKNTVDTNCSNWSENLLFEFYNKNNYLPNIHCMLDQECIDIINYIYHQDFNLLHYEYYNSKETKK